TQPTPNTIQFDLLLTSDGAITSDLRPSSVAYGVNFDTLILSGAATVSIARLSSTTDPIFPLTGFSFPVSTSRDHIRITQSPCSGCNYGGKGMVRTSNDTVFWVSGETFVCPTCTRAASGNPWLNKTIQINGVNYSILTVIDDSTLVLTTSAGSQTGVSYSINIM